MKEILMSIKPQYVAKILNKEKTIEVRKRFPSDYVGWVYIYCTKDHKNGLHWNTKKWVCVNNNTDVLKEICFNGKVVGRFWCDKVEEISFYPKKPFDRYGTPYRANYDLLTESCLEYDELDNYLNKNNGKAIHITKLEIFDKPKEISEFWNKRERMFVNGEMIYDHKFHLTRVPQSWQFIEV